jgi:2-polyprenyl-3-methyl-5-hydroxy-6-metoxy-1,4-benzoquinol methylase
MKRVAVKPRVGVRDAYARLGVKNYYERHAAAYVNPHALQVVELIKRNHDRFDCRAVLDLACGNGEVTSALLSLGYKNVIGIDPYTHTNYVARTQCVCYPLSFDDILQGKLQGNFSAIICSYGLHLVEESKLPALVHQLLVHTTTLVIITPHKRPELEKYGLQKVFEDAVLTEKGKKVRLKIYK